MKVVKFVGRQAALTFRDSEVLRPSVVRSSEVVHGTELRLFIGRERCVVVVLGSWLVVVIEWGLLSGLGTADRGGNAGSKRVRQASY